MTTPTGIPITLCDQCGHTHPVTRKHCPVCGLATLYGHNKCGNGLICQCAADPCGVRTLPHEGHCCLMESDNGVMPCGHLDQFRAVHEENCDDSRHRWRTTGATQDALPIGGVR